MISARGISKSMHPFLSEAIWVSVDYVRSYGRHIEGQSQQIYSIVGDAGRALQVWAQPLVEHQPDTREGSPAAVSVIHCIIRQGFRKKLWLSMSQDFVGY